MLPSREKLLWMYERMTLIREFEERLKWLVETGVPVGAVHEAMNLAAIWKLPVVFLCENNGYAQSTPVEYALSVAHVADRAAAYSMPGVTVDGQDVIAVWEVAATAVERARAGQGPSLIECMTYRYYGHHQGDDAHRYRTKEEEAAARGRDCIRRFP